MAILSSDKKYVTVEKGDNLWRIARTYSSYTGGASDSQLAAINGIPNKNLIYPGQRIYFSGSGSSSSSSTSSVLKILQFGILADSDNQLFVTWSWKRDKTDKYEVEWYYYTDNKIWFAGTSETPTYGKEQSIYTVPANANKVKVRIKPVAKSETKDNKTVYPWTSSWVTSYEWTVGFPPAKPSTPTVSIENFEVTATLDNINIEYDASHIEFEIVKDNASSAFDKVRSQISSRHASCKFTRNISAGSDYKVRARSYSETNGLYSEWSDYSGNLGTPPSASSGITKIEATSETSVSLTWAAASKAETYDIEYTTVERYFDTTDQTTTKNGIERTSYELVGLETGLTYYFRVRAVNADGSSAWSKVVSVVLGSEPSVPTTWSSTTTAIVGETVNLYWVHNSQDGSSETLADLEIYINSEKQLIAPIQNTETDEDEKDRTKVYTIDTSELVEGAVIQWRVRTYGIINKASNWSIMRTIDVYARPTVDLEVTNFEGNPFEILTAFPFYIYALGGPNTQVPIGYHVSITADEIYETIDPVGNVKMVNAGEEVYSKHFNANTALMLEMSAGVVNLDNNISYTVHVTVSMDSGLTAEATKSFIVTWDDVSYVPDAEIGIDPDTLSAHVRPYCEEGIITAYKVTRNGSNYTKTDVRIEEGIYGEIMEGVTTSTGEQVYNGTTASGETIYYCEVEIRTLVEGVTLSLYRREFDGSFTEIATGLPNTDQTFVTDPHPSLDLARYRVVAVTDSTGAVSFADIPGYPTGETSIVIQWDEEWSNFDISNEDEMQQPVWSGSLLKLPYNIDTSENSKPDADLIEYTGRSHPVSYYGTQLGHNASWSVDVPYDDKETIYALRRLQAWRGDVYVREPSGTGYWANITVSFSQKHRNVKVPVSLNIKRVEGGI